MNNIYAENSYQQPPNFQAIYNSLTRFQMPVDPNREAAPGVSFDDYPFPYVIGSDNEELRAQTQSIWDQWGNAAIRTGSQLVLGTLKAGTDIPDLFRAFFAPEGLAALADEEFSNDLSQAIANAMDSIKESTPIYLERDERGFVPWKAAWWANNMESIATGASMLLPTMGAAKGATWMSKMVGKAMQGSKSANLIMGKHSTAMVGSIVGALYGNAYESMLEMGELLPELKETLLQSGKSEEEVNKILKEEAGKIYWGNLPNAALDMLGIYQLTKPFGGELVETSVKKRLAKTTVREVVPEGLQELRNHYVSERSRASVNKIAGLRSTDYSLAEFVKDPNARTSGFFGALGGAAFAGGANTINQISENLSDKEDKRSWNKKMFSNVGRATLTGITKGEQKIANKQKEVLDRFAVRQQKLEELKTISELAGNKELYDSVKEEMTFLKGLEHLNLGTFDRFMKHIDSVEAQLKGLQQDEAAKANPALLKEAKDSIESLAKLKADLQKSKRHYNKGIKYYGLDTARLFDYTAFSVSLEKEKERLDKLVAGREEMFAEDEFGILRTTNSPKIEELKTKIAELETALTTGTSPDSVREKSILAEIQALKREVEESTDAKTLDDEVQLNIAQASLNIKELELRIKNVLRDKNYKDSGEDYFDDLYNEEKIKDLIFNAYNTSKFSADLDIDNISKELVTGKIPLSEASRDKVLSLIDAKLSEVRSSFYEKIDALIREEGIDPNTLEDEELAELEEKYRKQVENAISTEVSALQDLKNLAIRRTNFNPKRRTIEELIHSYIVDELKEVKESFKDIQDDETNTDLKTLSKLIDRLVILKSAIAATRYPVSTEDRKDVNDAIEEAKKLGGLIATRLESQSKDQTLILNKFMNDLIDIINAVRPFSGDITAPIIDASLKAIAADKATVKAVEDAIAIKAKEFREASVKLVNPTSLPLFQAQPGFSEVASETTPEQYLMSLMSVAYASANAPNQREYELTLDHNKILVDEVNKDVVQAYDELIPFVKLLRMLKSDKSFTEVITAIREDAKETGEYPFPDQLTTLIELSMWYSSSVDISYIQGIAGSGKTNLISKHLPNILNKLYKLDKKEIQALSNSPNTDRLIRKAVFGIEDIREIVTNDPSKLKAALANAKFLILDEIGKFSHLEIDVIHDALYGVNGLITNGHRLKILLTGDPNQFVNSTMSPSILPALNGYLSPIAHRIQIISPLTFSIRANNTEIVEFQNKFLKAGKDNVFTNGTVFTTSFDSDDQNGVRISPDRDTLKAIANKKLQAKENFVIIVEAEANKSLYKEFEADGVKRVYTFEEAQGSEWDSVLVDIQNYKKNVFGYTGANKMLYTAFSRAKNYIFMLTTALNENKPFNGLENQEVLEKLLNINEAKINANKINIEEGFDNLLGTAKVEEEKPAEEAKPEETPPVQATEETPFQEEEEHKEVQKLNEEEEESFTAEPIPGITLDKKGLPNLLKSEALNKGMIDVPWEGSNKDIHKKPVVIFDEAGNIYYIGNGKNIPGKVARLLELGAVKSEVVKVTFNTKYYLATDGSSVRKTRQILSRVPSNVIREAKWKSAEGKKKTTSNNKFEPSNIHEAVVSLFAGKATITPEFAATMFPPESSEYKRALAEGFIAPDNRMGTKGTKSKKSSAKAADDFWNLYGVRDLLGIREPSGRTHLTELQTAIQEVVFSGMSRKALRDSLRETKDEDFNVEDPYEGLDEEARKAQEEHDRLSKAEHDRLVSEIENYEALVSSMRATINAVAREYFDGTNFNFKGFLEHPAIQELLPIIPDSLLQYIQSLEDNYTSLVKKYPRYDGVVKLKRNRDGSVAESTSEVAIVYRALNPSERNKDKVIHKVYLLKEEFGYTELAVTTVPDTGQARLNYATDYTIEDIDRYVFNEGGYFKKGKVINFAKRKFIYNFANPVPFTVPDFQRIIEDVFKKSADVINRRTVAIRPVQLFVATDAAVEEIQTTYLDGKSALKLLNLDQVIAKELTGDGHELIMKRGNPYALIAIDTSDLDGTNIRTEYKVVELAGKKMNLGSSTALKDLGSLYSSIKELETILENEFNFTHKYASTSKQVEIEGEVYHEGMVFKNILHFKIEEESIASEAEFDEVAKVHEAINKHPKKVEIINALLKVKDGLYKHEEVGALATTTSLDFQSYEPYINEFVTIPGTKVTSLDDRTVLNILKDPSLHKFFKDKGYKFVLDSSNQRVLEARRTFEVGARSEDGVYRIFHVLVSIPFEKNSKTIDGWTLSAKAAPIIEIFKLQDITSYEDYLKKPNNEEAKASALHRGRDGKMFEKNKIFDSSTSTIPMQAGLAGLEDIQDVVTQVLTKTRKVKQLTAADEAINAIAKANGKIWIDENTYVKIQRKKIKTYGSGGQKTSITFGPNLLGSEVIFPLFRVVQKEGKLEEEPVFMSSEVVNGKEIVSQEGLDLRDLLELIFNPDMYDSQGNSMHNRSYTSIDGSPAKVGLREAIQDRPIKRANEVMNGSIDPASEEGQIGLAEMDKLAIPLVKFEETFVDIEESLDTIAVVTTPNLPATNASDEQIVKDVLDTFSLDEDPDDTVPFFHIDEASIGNSNLITEDQAVEYITRYIPGFDSSKELRAAIGSVIIGMQKYGPEILGAYKQGIVYLTMDESSNIELEVLRHELFHKIFDTYLPEHVKKALMAHVRAVTKVAMTDIQVEEYLARKFQAFTVKEEESDSKLLKFFTWLKNLIKSLFSATIRHEFGINHIFEQIESGAFNRKVAVESTGTKFMKDVTSLFPARTPSDSQKYSMKAINLVKYALLPYINNQDVIEEAAGKVWQDLMTRFVEGIIKHPSIKGLEPAVRKEIALGYLDPSKSLTDEEKLSKELVKETHLKALDNVGTFDDADMLPLYYLVMFKGRAFKAILSEVLPNKDLSQVKLREIYEDIIKSIPEDEAGEDNTVTENRNNFHEEYMQNATINQETRISKELKILLSFVERSSTFDFLPSRYAYAKTIESLMYLNTTGQIRDALNKIKAKDKTSNEALLASHLLKVYERSIQNGFNYKGTFYETKNTAILKAVTFRNGKFQVYNREVDEFGRTEQGVLTRLGTANYEFNVISILRREDSNLDEDFARAALRFIKVRDFSRDVMAKIYHELGSQVEVMPVVDQSSLTLGAYDELDFEAALAMEESLKEDFYLTTYNISAAGVKENIVASTRTSLQDLVLTKTKDEIKELASKAHSTDLTNILKMMGVSSFVGKTFTSGEQANIRQKYKEILNSIVLNYEEAKEDVGNIRAYLNATNFKSFTDIFTKNADFLSTLSYKGADGNTRYTYVVGSWVYDVLGALNEDRRSEYLLGEGYIAKNNYYIQKTSGIKNTADFDKMKQKNTDFDAVAYKNMSPGQFLAHRFMYSFIGTITRGKSKDRPTYIQYSFIQSNRNADTGIETNVMKFTEMKTAFEMAKAMEMARPKSLEKNVNYSTDKLRFMQYATFEDFRKAMSEQALKLFPEFIENMELVPGMSMTSSKGRRIFNTNEAIKRLIELGVLTEARVEFLTNYADKAYNENIRDHAKKLLPLWELFFMQNYIGAFHLTTAVFGDLAFAKDINDLVKRMQGVNSPGRKQLVTDISETPGNKVVSKMQVVKDSMFKVSELNDIKKYFSKIYGTLTATDGYTLGIPMTLRGIHKGTGDYNLKDIIKVVSFYVDPITNETRYLKSALFIITDELARMFPGLKSIRKKMESKGLTGDKLTRYNYLFEKIMNKNISPKETAEYEELTTNAIEYYATESALKIGRPKSQYLPEYGDVNEEGVIDIQNRYMRIQSNPFHEEGSVADPSQFNYFINVNGKNEEEAFKVYSKIEEILSLKQELLEVGSNLVTLDASGQGVVTERALRNLLINQMKNTPSGDDKVYNMLKAGVNINYPAVISKAIIALMNTMSRNSVELRHSGNKLVSQSAVGVRMFSKDGKATSYNKLSAEDRARADKFYSLSPKLIDFAIAVQDILQNSDPNAISFLKANLSNIKDMHGVTEDISSIFDEKSLTFNEDILVPRRLQMRDSEGYTEIIAPKWWLDKLGYKIGDKAFVLEEDYKKLLNTGMAVRIPTTGIHSAIAFKIVGSTEEGYNRIIAPEELVAIHGSDFDIDALFAIRREMFDDALFTSKVLEKIQDKELLKFIEESSLVEVTRGELVGYSFDGKPNTKFKKDLDTLLAMENLPSKVREIAITMKMKSVMNEKLDIEMSIITAAKNREDVNTPISFELIKHDLFKDDENLLKQALTDNKLFEDILYNSNYGVITKLKLVRGRAALQPPRDPFNIMDQMKYHKDNFEGDAGVGIQASISKAVSYMMYGTPLLVTKSSGQVFAFTNNEIQDITYTSEEGVGKVTLKNGDVHEGVLSREAVNIPNKFNIKFGKKYITYDSFTTTSRLHGHKTYELADTVLNGYLDNVKEQITWIMNATPITIEPIAYMIAIGMDLDLIALVLNQSSLKEYAASKMAKESRLSKTVKRLISVLKDSPVVEKAIELANAGASRENTVRKLEDLLEMNTLSFENLATALNYEANRGKTFSQLLDEFDNAKSPDPALQQYLLVQLQTLNVFQKLMQDGAIIGNVARGLDILRQFKITPADLYKKNQDLRNLSTNLGKFGNVSFFDIPNIRNARNAFDKAMKYYRNVFPIYSEEVEEAMNSLIDALGLTTTQNSYKLSGTNYAYIHGELQSLVASMVAERFKERIINEGQFFAPPSNTIDTLTGLFVMPEDITSKMIEDGQIESLNPEQAYVQIFLERLRQVKNEFSENMFLASLNIVIGKRGLLYLDFHKGSGNNPEYDALVETHFSQLAPEVKNALIYYDLYYNKAKFGFRSYSHHMGPQVSAELSDMYVRELTRVTDLISRDENFLHYLSYLLLRNEEVANYSKAVFYGSRSNHGDHIKILKEFGVANVEENKSFYKTLSMPSNGMKSTFIADGRYIYMLVGAYTTKAELISYNIASEGLLSFSDSRRSNSANSPDVFLFKRIDRLPPGVSYPYDFNMESNWINYFSNMKALMTLHMADMNTLLEKGTVTREYSDSLFYADKKGVLKEKDINDIPLTVRAVAPTVDTRTVIEVLYERQVTKVIDPFNMSRSKVHVKEFFKLPKTFGEIEANYQKVSVGTRVSKETLKKVTSKLSKRFGIKVEYEDNPNLSWSGMFKNGKVYINLAKASLDTPYHEFTHPFIAIIKKTNPSLYASLVEEVKKTELYERVKESRKDLSYTSVIEESIVEAIGLYSSVLYQDDFGPSFISLLKEFLQFISELLKELLRSPLVNTTTLSPNMTLKELAALVANTNENNKIDILGEYEKKQIFEHLTNQGLIKYTCKI